MALTLNDVVTNADRLSVDLDRYRDRNADWFSSIVAGVDAIIQGLGNCDVELQAEEAAVARGEPVNEAVLQRIQEIITRARIIIDASARQPEAETLIRQLGERLQQLKKQNDPPFLEPNPLNDVRMNYLDDANLPREVPIRNARGNVDQLDGGWRPTPKISRRVSARKTKTRSKTIKTKTKTKTKNKSATKFLSRSR